MGVFPEERYLFVYLTLDYYTSLQQPNTQDYVTINQARQHDNLR